MLNELMELIETKNSPCACAWALSLGKEGERERGGERREEHIHKSSASKTGHTLTRSNSGALSAFYPYHLCHLSHHLCCYVQAALLLAGGQQQIATDSWGALSTTTRCVFETSEQNARVSMKRTGATASSMHLHQPNQSTHTWLGCRQARTHANNHHTLHHSFPHGRAAIAVVVFWSAGACLFMMVKGRPAAGESPHLHLLWQVVSQACSQPCSSQHQRPAAPTQCTGGVCLKQQSRYSLVGYIHRWH